MREPPPHQSLWEQLNNSNLIRFLLLFAAGWALVQLLSYFGPVIVIFSFASILAFLLSYPVGWLKRYLPHGLAVGVVFFVGLAFIALMTVTVGLTVLAQGQQLLDRLTEILNSLGSLLQQLEMYLRSRNIQVSLAGLEEQLRALAISGVGISLAFVQSMVTNLLSMLLIAVITFFMLLDGGRLWNLLLKLVPKPWRNHFNLTIQRNFLGFFQGQLLLALFLTLATFLVFLGLQVPLALLLAFLAGFCNLIPGIGAPLGISLIFLFVLSQNIWLAFKVLIACIILQQIQDSFIGPRVMQNSLNLNPVVVFFALLVGARVAGLLGIFLAVPIAGVLVSLLEIEEMQGSDS